MAKVCVSQAQKKHKGRVKLRQSVNMNRTECVRSGGVTGERAWNVPESGERKREELLVCRTLRCILVAYVITFTLKRNRGEGDATPTALQRGCPPRTITSDIACMRATRVHTRNKGPTEPHVKF